MKKKIQKLNVGVDVLGDSKGNIGTRIINPNAPKENVRIRSSRPHSQTGITLVSLVITIIIMLILARSNHQSNYKWRTI